MNSNYKYTNIYQKALACLKEINEKNNSYRNINTLFDMIDDQFIDKKVNIISKMGCTKENSIMLLESMPQILFYSDEEIKKKLSMIYNSDNLYATLFCNNNSYEWASYDETNRTFRLMKYNQYTQNMRDVTEDSVIRTLIDSTYRKDIKKIAHINDDDTLEKRMVKLKKIRINRSGYRII